MSERLDKRLCLYGEPRLSNAQVEALRSLAAGPAGEKGQDWPFGLATVRSLKRQLMLEIDQQGVITIAPAGRKVLAAIDEAA